MNARLCLAVLSCTLLAACGSDPAREALVAEQSAAFAADPEFEQVTYPDRQPAPAQSGAEGISRIQVGMSDTEVREILSSPDSEDVGLSGRAFNPFYWGPNQSRATWTYKGKGRIIFDRNMYTKTMKVVRVIHNPEQP